MKTWIDKHTVQFIALVATTVSIASWGVFYSLGLTTDYNDAMSHLNIARLVIDNMQPGMSQLGSVWLPLSHILTLPLVWNDTLWHTGLAGSLLSMAAFVMGIVGIYLVTLELTDSKRASLVSTLAYALSLNLLYLQATPLTEPLYLCFFIFSILYLVKYLKYHSTKYLIALGILGALGILTRYDAWFVALIIGLIILYNELVVKKRRIQAAIGYFLLYLSPIVFGVMLWLGWNLLIFGDPLYAFVGPYSARAQQSLIESSSGLITKYNLPVSSWAYFLSVIRNIGVIVTALGALGWLIYFITTPKKRTFKLFSFLGLSSIIIFNVLALYLGFSILNLPELRWNPSGTSAGELFNVRYGILALPFLAVGVGLLGTRLSVNRRINTAATSLLVLLLLTQPVLTYTSGVITIEDGQVGSSAFVNQDIAKVMKDIIPPEDTIIMSTSSYNAVAFESGRDLKYFIHEGVSAKWNGAISEPDKYAKWVITANNDVGEPVYTSLVKNQKSAFLTKYTRVMTGAYASIYKLNN